MYVDLIRAYLHDYGSQAVLARAIGVTEAYLSYLLTPVGSRVCGYWGQVLQRPPGQVGDERRFDKTPSQQRAAQIADEMGVAGDRREVLLNHIRLARYATINGSAVGRYDPTMADSVIETIGVVHARALRHPDPVQTRRAYGDVWLVAGQAVIHIDAVRCTAQYAQVLMFLHDAASVLDRQDLALGFARAALLAIDTHGRSGDTTLNRFRINALLAEVVSLNNLGLGRDALSVARHAQSQPDYGRDERVWHRSFLEQQLSALIVTPRFSIYEVERIADDALHLTSDDAVAQAGIASRLVDGYLARRTRRGIRNAGRLVPELLAVISSESTISPLRRVRVLRTLARYHSLAGEHDEERRYVAEARAVALAANLSHQHRLM
jgi:hypothetical protein